MVDKILYVTRGIRHYPTSNINDYSRSHGMPLDKKNLLTVDDIEDGELVVIIMILV